MNEPLISSMIIEKGALLVSTWAFMKTHTATKKSFAVLLSIDNPLLTFKLTFSINFSTVNTPQHTN